MTELFHPRRHVWVEHFDKPNVLIVGKSVIGRATVEVLRLNPEEQVELRSAGTI